MILPDNVDGTPLYGGFSVGDSMPYYAGGTWYLGAENSTWYGINNSSPTVATGQTYFVVIEEVLGSGSNNDSVYAWLNPTPGSTAPSTASAFAYKTGIDADGDQQTPT